MLIYLIRHGETRLNASGTLQGWMDVPLNENGIELARITGRNMRPIRFDRCISSPLIRAVETARIIAGDTKQVTDERLIEMDYGPYEGMDLNHPAPEVMRFFRDFTNTPAPEGMEPLAEVVSRLGDFLEDISKEAAGKTILVSTHAIAMKGALEYLTPESKGSYWSTYIENCAVYTSQMNGNGELSIPEKW